MTDSRVRSVYVLTMLAMLAGLLCQCGPTSSPEPTAQPGPADATPEIEPPPAVLEVGGEEQVSGIGSFCWADPGEGVALCADMLGIVTPEEPLVALLPLTARFHLSPQEEAGELSLRVIRVSADDEILPSGEDWRAWSGAPGDLYPLALERAPQIELNLAPGLYVLELFGRWEHWGDASYGFLLEARE